MVNPGQNLCALSIVRLNSYLGSSPTEEIVSCFLPPPPLLLDDVIVSIEASCFHCELQLQTLSRGCPKCYTEKLLKSYLGQEERLLGWIIDSCLGNGLGREEGEEWHERHLFAGLAVLHHCL
jgi:hypothetical protein